MGREEEQWGRGEQGSEGRGHGHGHGLEGGGEQNEEREGREGCCRMTPLPGPLPPPPLTCSPSPLPPFQSTLPPEALHHPPAPPPLMSLFRPPPAPSFPLMSLFPPLPPLLSLFPFSHHANGGLQDLMLAQVGHPHGDGPEPTGVAVAHGLGAEPERGGGVGTRPGR